MGYEVGHLKRYTNGNYAAHRLSDKRSRLIDLGYYFGDEIIQAMNIWLRRRCAKARPPEMNLCRRMRE